MRLLGIDHGGKRTGLALGDTETRLALPFSMIEGLPDEQLARAIGQVVRKEGIEAIVVGIPLNADGTVSNQSKIVERFIVMLMQEVGVQVPVYRMSEHLTSHDSEGKLAGLFTRNQKRQRVDAIAAARILQDWLDQQPR
ncbi:MAG: Holliday junction resolvase RuvX [Phycisphaerales bacterium]|nr:Holliday junction resolvase RuvX [Phycisphaerales bacterium]